VVVNKNKKGIQDNLSSYSMGIVERSNLTIEYLIERYMEVKQTLTYHNVFDKLIENYNNSPHLALAGYTPKLDYLINPTHNEIGYMLMEKDLDNIDRADELLQKIQKKIPGGFPCMGANKL
jgi:hypothetical protein